MIRRALIALVAIVGIVGSPGEELAELKEQRSSPEAPSCVREDAPLEASIAENVPVIDVSALMNPSMYTTLLWNRTAEEVSRACEDWGFFQVDPLFMYCHVNHLPGSILAGSPSCGGSSSRSSGLSRS